MRIAHVFAHEATNLGDIYLKRATQDAFSVAFPGAEFNEVEVRQLFTDADIARLNEHDLVLIGGGGLLLRDTFPNTESDWQWACSPERVRLLTAPTVVYAVGYNRFRGQEDFARPLFDRQLEALVERSAFFSLRNRGSIRAVRGYLPEELHDRVHLNHCPSLLYPRVVPDRRIGSRKVGILLAGDRLGRRHPDMAGFTKRIRSLLERLTRFSELFVVAHQPHDLWYVEQLEGLPHRVVDLVGASPEKAMAFYSGLDVMIGDRGHAQMIPFALGCRIISLVSHDKLAWFLDDIGIEDHGVEEGDPSLADKVLALVYPVTGDDYTERRVAAMREISRTADVNLDRIVEAVDSHRREEVACPV